MIGMQPGIRQIMPPSPTWMILRLFQHRTFLPCQKILQQELQDAFETLVERTAGLFEWYHSGKMDLIRERVSDALAIVPDTTQVTFRVN
jgi:hypothetical protein